MNEKDAATLKALAELGLHKEQPLTPEQERLWKRALDPHEDYLAQLEEIFCENDDLSDFDDLDVTLHDLYKRQLARCHEVWIYYHRLANTYDASGYFAPINLRALQSMDLDEIGPNGINHYSYVPDRVRDAIVVVGTGLHAMKAWADYDKFIGKWNAMLAAKKAFEQHGGQYPDLTPYGQNIAATSKTRPIGEQDNFLLPYNATNPRQEMSAIERDIKTIERQISDLKAQEAQGLTTDPAASTTRLKLRPLENRLWALKSKHMQLSTEASEEEENAGKRVGTRKDQLNHNK